MKKADYSGDVCVCSGQNVGRQTAESADLKHWRIARQARNRVVHQIKVARFQHSRVRVAKPIYKFIRDISRYGGLVRQGGFVLFS